MCLVRLASGYKWKDGLESSRGRRRPCRCHDFRQGLRERYANANSLRSGPGRARSGLTDCGLTGPKNAKLSTVKLRWVWTGTRPGSSSFRCLATCVQGRASHTHMLPLVGPPRPKATFLTSPSTTNSPAPPGPSRPPSAKAICLQQ